MNKKSIPLIVASVVLLVAVFAAVILLNQKPQKNNAPTDEEIKNILPTYEDKQEIYKSGEYSLRVNLVDEHSPDRILTLYKNEKEIKFKEIRYVDDIVLCKYENPTIAVFDLEEDNLIVVLENDEKINFDLKKEK